MEPLYELYFLSTHKIDPHNSITNVVMFDGDSNVQIAGNVLKIHHLNISVICGVKHTVALFFNDVSKIPVANKIIRAHKAIYNLSGSGIYHRNSLYIQIKII